RAARAETQGHGMAAERGGRDGERDLRAQGRVHEAERRALARERGIPRGGSFLQGDREVDELVELLDREVLQMGEVLHAAAISDAKISSSAPRSRPISAGPTVSGGRSRITVASSAPPTMI